MCSVEADSLILTDLAVTILDCLLHIDMSCYNVFRI